MVTSPFFNNFNQESEQNLFEDMVVESIKIYGHDVFYLPRITVSEDKIMNEFNSSKFEKKYEVEVYIKNFSGYEGEGSFLQKFGLEIRDQVTLTIANRTFEQDIAEYENITRPREGDLIYIPMLKAAYQIKFVENASVFYQLGKVYSYDMVCELFEYSNETFETGIPDLDNSYNKYFDTEVSNTMVTESGTTLSTEDGEIIIVEDYEPDPQDIFADNREFEQEADNILDFTEHDPFSEGGTY